MLTTVEDVHARLNEKMANTFHDVHRMAEENGVNNRTAWPRRTA